MRHNGPVRPFLEVLRVVASHAHPIHHLAVQNILADQTALDLPSCAGVALDGADIVRVDPTRQFSLWAKKVCAAMKALRMIGILSDARN